jgi:23S rRNA pseudouridine2605 synthase
MNKPRGVLSAVSDERERTVIDLLPAFYRSLGVFPVGRLDRESEGLIILTNDGAFAQELIHPSKGVPRTYIVRLRYEVNEARLAEWQSGVVVGDRRRAPLEVTREADDAAGRCFRVVLGEGFKREIRLMAGAIGNRVVRLRRVAIGKLFLEKLPVGAFCEYNCKEMLDMISSGGQV